MPYLLVKTTVVACTFSLFACFAQAEAAPRFTLNSLTSQAIAAEYGGYGHRYGGRGYGGYGGNGGYGGYGRGYSSYGGYGRGYSYRGNGGYGNGCGRGYD